MPNLAPRIAQGHFAAAKDVRSLACPVVDRQDPLDADRLDFGAWLLPPADVGYGGRVVRLVSTALGPVAAVAAFALTFVAIF